MITLTHKANTIIILTKIIIVTIAVISRIANLIMPIIKICKTNIPQVTCLRAAFRITSLIIITAITVQVGSSSSLQLNQINLLSLSQTIIMPYLILSNQEILQIKLISIERSELALCTCMRGSITPPF